MKKCFIIILFILSGLAGFLFSYYKYNHQSQIKTIEVFHYPAILAKQWEHDPQAGKKIFKEFCSTCHAAKPMIDVNAPKISDKKVWDALKKTGKKNLLKNTIQGMGAMPARGGCFECSDAQLKEAIEYMIK